MYLILRIFLLALALKSSLCIDKRWWPNQGPNNYNPNYQVCFSNPCMNGGMCSPSTNPGSAAPFQCNCLYGSTGLRCENWINPCRINPCQNGGSCKVLAEGRYYTGGSFYCVCPKGFYGSACQFGANPCATIECLYDGICVSPAPGEFFCRCKWGYGGKYCESMHQSFFNRVFNK